MCVIYACSTTLPPFDELERGFETNSDGAGLAWLDTKKDLARVLWKKDFKNHKELLEHIQKQNIPFPLAIHFRTASVGPKNPELAHPFPLGKGAPTWLEGSAGELLFHNGHWSDWEKVTLAAGLAGKEPFPEGAWSDSRALAWLVHLKGPGILHFVLNSSRVLLFHAHANTAEDEKYDPAEDHFTFYGTWIHKKEGWSQSIDTYSRMMRTPGRYGAGGAWEWDERDELPTTPHRPYSPSKDVPNVWTVAELNQILSELQEEQKNAKLAAGI